MSIEDLIDKPIDPKLNQLPQLHEFFQLVNGSQTINRVFYDKLSQITQNASFEYKLELVIENQRGLKMFGIPVFSDKSLVPLLDPSNFQAIDGKNLRLINNNLHNLPLPGLNWQWDWDTWYILMLNDVDDQGWIYSKWLFRSHHWKGKYYFGNFIRRRVWIRLRKREKINDK